ncbi:helix-turn-helix domain-containing protein [Trichothermofontia sp.]
MSGSDLAGAMSLPYDRREFTPDPWQGVIHQVEVALCESDVYRQALAKLRQTVGETAEELQLLLYTIGKEAIRLALTQVAQHPDLTTVAPPPDVTVPPPATPNPTPEASSPDRATVLLAEDWVPNPKREVPKKPRLSKAQQQAIAAAQAREERLLEIGSILKQARANKRLSLGQLHSLTLVPTHQITALEVGQLDHLPEDIYIRGFIRQLGNALGLNGTELAASLPKDDPNRGVVPSWYHPIKDKGLYLQLSLYFGYAAVMAGAMGGLAWVTQQTTLEAVDQPVVPPAASLLSQVEKATPVTSTPGMQANGKVAVGSEIAAPEALPY